jgi:glycosyltransferase involved in cell wall biosynthesis
MQPELLPTTSPGRPIRLAVFTSHPIQYQAPLFRALAQRAELRPTVFFGSRHGVEQGYDHGFDREIAWDIPLLDGYEHVFLPNRARRPDVGRFLGISVPEIEQAWTRQRFDAALVLGWHTRGHVQAIRAAWRAGLPLLLRGESHLAARPPGVAGAWARAAVWLPVRRQLYTWALRRTTAVVAIGTRNAEYFRHFGVPSERIYTALYCVDNQRFLLSDVRRREARARIRAELDAGPDDVVFVAAGKLIPKKRPFDVVRALTRLGGTAPATRVLFLGEGPQRQQVEALACKLGVEGRVGFSGFVNQRAIPEWYAAGDCLVLASDHRETWGLVVNEAMAAGLPIIASDAVGCAPDLVRPGENGWTYPLGDVAALAQAMARLASLAPSVRAALGTRSPELGGGRSTAGAAGAGARRLVDARAGCHPQTGQHGAECLRSSANCLRHNLSRTLARRPHRWRMRASRREARRACSS